jgi:hypothetical protein
MHAYVFVYSQSKFKVGSNPLVRFQVGSTYIENTDTIAIDQQTEAAVVPGIYVISADADDAEPEISVVEGRRTIDYDQFLIKGKDSWPELIGGRSIDPDMRGRVLAKFPDLHDEDLEAYLEPRNAA